MSAVSLLFPNDGNWTTHSEKPSALYFHDEVSYNEAAAICLANNETLLGCNDLSFFGNQFSYLKFTGQLNESSTIWVANSQLASFDSEAPSCKTLDPSLDAKSAFICTNMAPFTSKVDTDFSAYPRVQVDSNGTKAIGTRDHMSFRFTGVPYAKAPVGDLRFSHAHEWRGGQEVDATSIKPGCLQFGNFSDPSVGLNPWGLSEDCLYINIFTSHLPLSSSAVQSLPLKPVMVWYHGGGNTVGTGSDATFEGGSLVSRSDVVLVNVNYRLNIFGYLGLDNETIPGNFALSDKIMALKWVKKHVAAFGGDPERVTIFGQSAGGWSVGELVTSPRAKGLFSTAIAQSGVNIGETTYENIHALVDPVLSPLCNGTITAECLRSLPAETLLNVTLAVPFWNSVTDGNFRVGSAVDRVALGSEGANVANFMTGFMPEEGQSILSSVPGHISPNATDFEASLNVTLGDELAQRVIDSELWNITEEFTVYNATQNAVGEDTTTCPSEEFITSAAKSGAFSSMYVYLMERAYGLNYFNPFGLCSFPVGHPQPYYRCHSGDLYEVFGTYYIFDQPVRNSEDIYHTNFIQDIWGSFARTGDPNVDKKYLMARGYESTFNALEGWRWEQYSDDTENVAALQWADLKTTKGLLDADRCAVLGSSLA